MGRLHCRCRNCDTRRVLPKHPDEYKVAPKCRTCGKRMYSPKRAKVKVETPVLRVDGWMNRRTAMNRKLGCTCAGYGWEGNMTGAMHRRGSKKCWYRANGEMRAFGDKDYYRSPEEVEADMSSLNEFIETQMAEIARVVMIPADMLLGEPRGFDAVDEGAYRRWRRQFGLV